MSNLSNTIDIISYVTNQTKPLAGLELIPVHFKTDTETKIKPESKAVNVAFITDAEVSTNLTELMPSIKSMLLEVRKDILREAVLDGKSFLQAEDLSISGCVKFLATINAGSRIDKNMLSEWFDSVASEVLSVVIAEKLGITDSDTAESAKYKKLADTLETYKGYFVKLSTSKTVLSIETIAALEKALSYILAVDSSNKISTHIAGKLSAMKEKPKADLLAL